MPFSAARAKAIQDFENRGTAITTPAAHAIQFHTGPPGPAGILNVAADNSRYAIAWAAASAVDGSAINSAIVPIAARTATEACPYVSEWSSLTPGAGVCLGFGQVTSGGNFTNGVATAILAGQIKKTFAVT